VNFILVDPRAAEAGRLRDGRLADVAPTILSVLGIEPPAVMDGSTLTPGRGWGGRRRCLLIILDGWGIGKQDDDNPIHLAPTPVWDTLLAEYPSSCLLASGEAVGLQPGKAGNSEAGHLNLGAGRIVLQDDVRLDQALKDGTFARNEVFQRTFERVKQQGTALHLLGLLTEKSSHGCIDYPLELLRAAGEQGLQEVFLHVIFDGRSTEPGSAPALLEKLENQVGEIGTGMVVTGVGRGIALDRDGNYGKIRRAFEALVHGSGKACPLGSTGMTTK
jgi:2,3-bisphosphoglycerate-independent phosphoglycerate mutase